jgi:dipeptidase
MCDTIVAVRPEGVLFAKNSDRDANEAQFPEWHPARNHAPDATVHCTYLEIPQVAHTYSTLLSRPFWMWGAEIGANEFGVTIGNEAVFTTEKYAKTGLTGMDMIRLAVERAKDRTEAVGVIVDLLEKYGQGGGCGFEKRSFTYHNSFIVADPTGAIVLETAGRKWATEEVAGGVRTISNGLTIPGFADEYRDKLRSRVSACDIRTSLTSAQAEEAERPCDLMRVLRSHGPHPWPRYRALNGTLSMPCMHGGGIVAASSSTAGWVADLTSDVHWISGTSAQCLSLFKPTRVSEPVDIGPEPSRLPESESLWWTHEQLARTVMRDPEHLASTFLGDRDENEQDWSSAPPRGQEAFDYHHRALGEWWDRVAQSTRARDVRPWYARRYWNKRAG